MCGVFYLDIEVFATRLWEGGFGGLIGSHESRAADERNVRLLTSYLGEVAQRACDKFGGDLMGVFHQQHGDVFFACIADCRE
jgi:hypothetical protein